MGFTVKTDEFMLTRHSFVTCFRFPKGNNDLKYKQIHIFCLFSGGVGFDINCGVRLVRTNLDLKDVQPVREQLAQVTITFSFLRPFFEESLDFCIMFT